MRFLACATLFLVLGVPSYARAAVNSEFTVRSDGSISAKNLTVMQKAGPTLFVRATWGEMFVRITVLGSAQTPVSRAFGEAGTLAQIQEGDIVDIEGKLTNGSGALMMTPTMIRNASLTRADKDFSGTISSVNHGSWSALLLRNTSATTTLTITPTTTITKGVRTIPFSEVATGDRVLTAAGEFEYTRNTLTVRSMELFQDPALFTAKNFQGTLTSLSARTLPAEAVVDVGGVAYRVFLPAGTSILSAARKPAALSRFETGDTLRFFGKIRTTNLREVDAEVFRNLDF